MTNNSSNNINKGKRPSGGAPRQGQKAPQRKAAERKPGILYWAVLAITAIMLLLAIAVTGIGGAVFGIKALITKEPENNNGGGEITSSKGKHFGTVLPSISPEGTYKPTGVGTDMQGISGEIGILVDAATGEVIASKNPDEPIHPASMTKIMTLIIAAENAKDPNKKLSIEQDMVDIREELKGTGEIKQSATVVKNGAVDQINLVGYQLSLEDTMYLINYASDTVACLMVAKHVAGSEEAFVQMMNDKAEALGLTQTSFVNTTGLTNSDKTHNKTTARDMATIMAYAIKNEVVKAIISRIDILQVELYNSKGKSTGYKISTWAKWQNGSDQLAGKTTAGNVTIKGGKNGYEDIPHKTASFATYGINNNNKKIYICVVASNILNGGGAYTGATKVAEDMRNIYRNYAK